MATKSELTNWLIKDLFVQVASNSIIDNITGKVMMEVRVDSNIERYFEG